MKIVHICLASSYTEGMGYQENHLVAQNLADGHDVLVITNCQKFINGKLTDVNESVEEISEKFRIIRLKFKKFISNYLSNKLKYSFDFSIILDEYKPDVILHHGIFGNGIHLITKYIEKNPKCKFFVDNHQDFFNTGRNYFVWLFLYKLYANYFFKKSVNNIEKIFFITDDCKNFILKTFDVPLNKLEYFPLGGKILDQTEINKRRKIFRDKNNLCENDIVFFHAGKMCWDKKTIDVMESFDDYIKLNDSSSKLILAGTVDKRIERKFNQILSSNEKILYLGWLDSKNLIDALCGSDVYVQPGSQSATLQSAICLSLPVIVYPYISHQRIVDGNGIYVKNANDIKTAYAKFINSDFRQRCSIRSNEIANKILNYIEISRKITQ